MLYECDYLTKREKIIYFFCKNTKGKLNKNCNERKFYEKRGCGFIYDYIIHYFDDINSDLKKLKLSQKCYHIYNNLNELPKDKKFINFSKGYIGIRKKNIIDKKKRITFENVLFLNFKEIYTLEKVKELLKDYTHNCKNNLIYNFFDKKLLYSIYQHTLNFKFVPFNFRVKLLKNEINENELKCKICKNEISFNGLKIKKTCSNIKCLNKLRSQNAKNYDLSFLRTKEVNYKRAKTRTGIKISEETRQKMRESNKKVWTDEYRIKDRKMRIERGCDMKISQTMKRKILNGELTPKTENRKRSKRIKSNITGLSYRSNWELIFHENNPSLQYELIRIKYMDNNNERIYITDFVDMENKIIYEIKPTSELKEPNFLNKLKYTEEWCLKNKFQYKVITEKDYNFYGRKTKPE